MLHFCNAEVGENTAKKAESQVEFFTDLVEVLAQQSSGLRGRQVTEFGHEVHLPLGEHAGGSPQLSLPLSDGLILVLNSCIQSLNRLIKLEQCSLLLHTPEGKDGLNVNIQCLVRLGVLKMLCEVDAFLLHLLMRCSELFINNRILAILLHLLS